MLVTIAVILLVLWGLGFAMRILGGTIHTILVVAVIILLVHFLRGGA